MTRSDFSLNELFMSARQSLQKVGHGLNLFVLNMAEYKATHQRYLKQNLLSIGVHIAYTGRHVKLPRSW